MFSARLTWQGITPADFQQAARALRPEMAKVLEAQMHRARVTMTMLASGPVLRRRSGRTAMAISRGQVKTAVTPAGVVGTLTHRGLLLNIHEGGADQPARAIRAKRRKALRFRTRDGVVRFVHRGGTRRRIGETGVIRQSARRLPARPLGKRALDALLPETLAKIEAVVVARILNAGGARAAV